MAHGRECYSNEWDIIITITGVKAPTHIIFNIKTELVDRFEIGRVRWDLVGIMRMCE